MTPRNPERRRIPLSEGLARIPGSNGERFATVFERGSLTVEVYAPRERDEQTPHDRDELYIVIQGSGNFFCEGSREPFGPGDFLFAPAGAEHRFESFSDDLAVWVIFYGPEGGEKVKGG